MRVLHLNCNYLGSALHQTMIEHLERLGIENQVFVPTYSRKISVVNVNKNVIVSETFRKWDRLLFRVTTELLCVCVVSYILKGFLCQLFASTTILMILTYGFYLIVVLLLNRAKILDSIKNLNGLK